MTEPGPPPSSPPATPPAARWPDAALAALVLAFAFLAASFPARNSDLWQHLASGRLLAQGEYVFGSDPFAYTTEDVYWANHAWLFDLALYAGHQALGGAGLVALKALAVAVLAGLMLRLARPRPWPEEGGPFWIGCACVLLAVLAMSPRLLLQPACLSLLLLAVCLWLLHTGGRALIALPALVALWVNLDAWFLLGPLLVALFWLGQRLAPDARRFPPWLLPACLAACLFSPHHVRALALPVELSPAVWRSELRHDVRFAHLFASPWRLAPLGQVGGFNLAAWGYFVLLALGLVSFAVNRSALRGWRLPVWLAFALLGAWQARLVPFFAVVAGPIAALNLRERVSVRALAGPGRAGLLLAGLVLVALAWPGWLQGFHRRDRPLAWAVHADPSLVRVADTLARWRQQGALPPEARTFATHPDVAHYCAWFCPGEKGFLDHRLGLFVPVAASSQRICLALGLPVGPSASEREAQAPSSSGWRTNLRDHNIACAVLYDPDLRRLAPGLRQVAPGAPGHWELLRVDGQAVLVRWREAPGAPLASHRFDAERATFGPGGDHALPPAPGRGPAQLARPLAWWELFLERPGGTTWEASAAGVYVRLFEDGADWQLEQQRTRVLARHATGLAGSGALPTGPMSSLPVARLALEGVFLSDLKERPPALPLLGARAARRALAIHPDDAGAWLRLAQAYLALGRTTTEANAPLPVLARVRHVQTVTALVQAIASRPDLMPAHGALALLYADAQFLDLALKHRSAQLVLARKVGRLPGEGPGAFADRIEGLAKAIEEMESVVQDNENRFVVRSGGLAGSPLARARLALDLGLAGKALDVLLRSHADLYGAEGLRLLLDLLLLTGQAQDARDLLDRDELRRNPAGLGLYDLPGGARDGRRWSYRFLAYDWFDLCQAAAAGHYDRASSALDRLRTRLKREGNIAVPRLTPELAWRATAEVGLGAVPAAIPLRVQARVERSRVAGWMAQAQFVPVERADLHALEGMLLLEQGWPAEAGEHFRRALALYRLAGDTALALPGRPLAVRYLDRLNQTRPK